MDVQRPLASVSPNRSWSRRACSISASRPLASTRPPPAAISPSAVKKSAYCSGVPESCTVPYRSMSSRIRVRSAIRCSAASAGGTLEVQATIPSISAAEAKLRRFIVDGSLVFAALYCPHAAGHRPQPGSEKRGDAMRFVHWRLNAAVLCLVTAAGGGRHGAPLDRRIRLLEAAHDRGKGQGSAVDESALLHPAARDPARAES